MENLNQNMENQAPKKTTRSFWPMVLISAVSFLVGGFLVWAAYNQGLDEQLNSLLPGNQRLQRENAERLHNQAVADTTNWKTYKNEEHGFEFKYPENKYALEDLRNFEPNILVSLYNIQSKEISEKCKCGEIERFQVSYFKSNNVPIFTEKDNVVTHVKGGYVYVVNSNTELISTFKFASDQAEWKTYKNDEYGFEFKYPEDWYISTKAIDEIKRGSSDLVVLLTNAPEEKEQRYVEELRAYDGIGASENHVDLLNGNLILITAHDLSVEYFKDFKKELGFEFKNITDLNHSVGNGVRGNWYITWEMFKDTDAVYLPFNGSMNNQWGRLIKSISFWIDRNNGKYEKEVFEEVVDSFKYIK